MSARIDKGKRWFKYTVWLVLITAGVKAVFALGYSDPGKPFALALLLLVTGPILLGGPAFLLGWLTGEKEGPVSPPSAQKRDAAPQTPMRGESQTTSAVAQTDVAVSRPPPGPEPSQSFSVDGTVSLVLNRHLFRSADVGGDASIQPRSVTQSPPTATDVVQPGRSAPPAQEPTQVTAMERERDASVATVAGDPLVRAAFAQAMHEVKTRTYDDGLWALSLVEAQGDERAAGITYLRVRGAELEVAARKQLDEKLAAQRQYVQPLAEARWDTSTSRPIGNAEVAQVQNLPERTHGVPKPSVVPARMALPTTADSGAKTAVIDAPTRWEFDARKNRMAAAEGDAVAQNNLGSMYFNGQGVPQDYVEAARWYRKAADQGLPQAQRNLGSMYFNGHGVPQDFVRAHKWLSFAASGFSVSEVEQRNGAVKMCEIVAAKMTPDQLAKAQRLAREWKRTK